VPLMGAAVRPDGFASARNPELGRVLINRDR
jgi:hypothetical protein